ncbi:hypothetical protein CK934_09215 [Chitinophaga sp. MD30]|nr:hypothetical protein CK934_09215 [Chitinophaga sp. MD30]
MIILIISQFDDLRLFFAVPIVPVMCFNDYYLTRCNSNRSPISKQIDSRNKNTKITKQKTKIRHTFNIVTSEEPENHSGESLID